MKPSVEYLWEILLIFYRTPAQICGMTPPPPPPPPPPPHQQIAQNRDSQYNREKQKSDLT